MSGDATPEERMAYIARTRAGKCTGITLDLIGHEGSTAKIVAHWIQRGDVVRYTTADAARIEFAMTLQREQMARSPELTPDELTRVRGGG
jgi:hypothetical protein